MNQAITEQLLRYWPTSDAIDECIGVQAEALDESVFLAVHQPMRLLSTNPAKQESIDENEFLRRFLDTPYEKTSLFVVVGDSGIGKTHLIRWLDIQLADRKASGSIIKRIPRTAGLRRVIEILTEDLQGPAYAEVHDRLGKAQEQLDPTTAVFHLQGNLAASLINASEEANREIQAHIQRGERPSQDLEFIKSFGSQRMLPSLITDPSLFDHFVGSDDKPGILRRIAQNVTRGSDDPYELVQFEDKHLDLENVDVTGMSAPARMCHSALRIMRHREQAVKIINKYMDDAVRRILTADPNELTELFTIVRRELYKEGRELILLVEDFTVLTGLQEALLDVMIQPGYRDGVQQFCTMRTAIAVTEGHWKPYETVETRSSRWKLEGIPGTDIEDDTAPRIVDLVGAYLNAARVGKKCLQEVIGSASRSGEELAIPSFDTGLDTEAVDVINDFGRSSAGYPLFPFNPTAIRYLARYFGPAGGGIQSNPRMIIKAIIQPTIRGYRNAFATGAFPPENLLNIPRQTIQRNINPQLAIAVQANAPDHQAANRLLTLISVWGGCQLRDRQVPHIARGVYDAFGLSTRVSSPQPPQPRTPPPPPPPPPRGEDWDTILSNWTVGQGMPGQRANDLREAVAECVVRAIDWDRELMKKVPINDREYRGQLYIAGVTVGNRTDESDSLLILCSEAEFADSSRHMTLRATFAAVMRHYKYGTWDYPDADSDYPLYANYIERKAREVVEYLRCHYLRARNDTIPQFVGALYSSSLVLGIEGTDQDDSRMINALFEPNKDVPPPLQAPVSWNDLRTTATRIRAEVKESPRSFLLLQIGARQGGGPLEHAVDCIRILDEVAAFRATWPNIHLDLDTPDETLKAAFIRVNAFYGAIDRVAKREKDQLAEWSRKTAGLLGTDMYTVPDIADAMKNALNAGESVYDGRIDVATLRQLIEGFRNADTDELFQLPTILESPDRDTLVNALARVDRSLIRDVDMLVENVIGFLNAVEQTLGRLREEGDPKALNTKRSEVAHELHAVRTALVSLLEKAQ